LEKGLTEKRGKTGFSIYNRGKFSERGGKKRYSRKGPAGTRGTHNEGKKVTT